MRPARRSPAAAAALAAAVLAAAPAAAGTHADVPALIVTDVAPGARSTMPERLWRKLAVELLHARDVAADEGAVLPDAARCRGAHALYAVLATFDRAMRLPGLAQDPDRAYAVARITVRNCTTNDVATKMLRIESDPVCPPTARIPTCAPRGCGIVRCAPRSRAIPWCSSVPRRTESSPPSRRRNRPAARRRRALARARRQTRAAPGA